MAKTTIKELLNTYGITIRDLHSKGYNRIQISRIVNQKQNVVSTIIKEFGGENDNEYLEKRQQLINKFIADGIKNGKSLGELEDEICIEKKEKKYFYIQVAKELEKYKGNIIGLYNSEATLESIMTNCQIHMDFLIIIIQRYEYISMRQMGYKEIEMAKSKPELFNNLTEAMKRVSSQIFFPDKRYLLDYEFYKARKKHISDVITYNDNKKSMSEVLEELGITGKAEEEFFYKKWKSFQDKERKKKKESKLNEFINLYNQGLSFRQIAEKMGIENNAIMTLAQKSDPMGKKISKEEHQNQRKKFIEITIREGIESGDSLDVIKKRLDISKSYISYYNKCIEDVLKQYRDKIKNKSLQSVEEIVAEYGISSDIGEMIINRQRFIELYNKGYNTVQAAKELGITEEEADYLNKILKSDAEKIDGKAYSRIREAYIVREIKDGKGLSYKELLEKLGIKQPEEMKKFLRLLKKHDIEKYNTVPVDERNPDIKSSSKLNTDSEKGDNSQSENSPEKEQEKRIKEEDIKKIINEVYSFFKRNLEDKQEVIKNPDDLIIKFWYTDGEKKSLADEVARLANKGKTISINGVLLKENEEEYKAIVMETFKHVRRVLANLDNFKKNKKGENSNSSDKSTNSEKSDESTNLEIYDVDNLDLRDRFFLVFYMKKWLDIENMQLFEVEQLEKIKEFIVKLGKLPDSQGGDSQGDDGQRSGNNGIITINNHSTSNTIENAALDMFQKITGLIKEKSILGR